MVYQLVIFILHPYLLAFLGFFVAWQFWRLRHKPYYLMYHEKRLISIAFLLLGAFYVMIQVDGNAGGVPDLHDIAMLRFSVFWLEFVVSLINRRIMKHE